ncbi:MAG: hypothetical protein QXR44_04730 [Thermoproteota archaeon]
MFTSGVGSAGVQYTMNCRKERANPWATAIRVAVRPPSEDCKLVPECTRATKSLRIFPKDLIVT